MRLKELIKQLQEEFNEKWNVLVTVLDIEKVKQQAIYGLEKDYEDKVLIMYNPEK